MNRPALKGAAHTPILVFAGIVGLSVVFFFLFSMGGFSKKPEPETAPAPAAAAAKPAPSIAGPGAVTAPSGALAGVPGEQPSVFTTAESLLKALAEAIAAADRDRLTKLAGSGPRTDFLLAVGKECGWQVSPESPWADAGEISGVSRHQLKLEPAPPGTIMFDLERSKTEGWKVHEIRIEAAVLAAAADLIKSPGVTFDAAALAAPADALDQGRKFFIHVIGHDFKAARSLTDETAVTHEKLAGLCIVFEEGEYRIADRRPVVVTAGTAESAWAIVKIRSEKQNLDSEVGLEMSRATGGEWRIQALDFNRMLESYVQASGSGKVFYSPIVRSAKGGESIVLYFEFDKSDLHPRALHQLDIIAGLLKSDPARKMRITGHTDALGTDDYNARLSAARAKNVHARLVELGVSATQIVTVGMGATTPLDPDRRTDGSDNPDGRSRNRRTEIYLDF